MAKISEVYAGSFVTGGELQPLGQRRAAVIHTAEQENVGQNELKIVLSLVSQDGKAWPRRVVLNKSNALMCARAFGDDSDAWAGQAIEIWAENVMFQGRMVPGIKLGPAPTLPLAAPPAKSQGASWREPPPARPKSGGGPIEDDEIPF